MTSEMAVADGRWFVLCDGAALLDGAAAVGFEVLYQSEPCRAFAIRFEGQVRAYLNRCTHVAMEMDWVPDQFFSSDRQWLLCATHGATHEPLTGRCVGGPCTGGLIGIELREESGVVYWRSQYEVAPINF